MERIEKFISRCTYLQDATIAGEVEALIVGGSVGRGEANHLSDIDFFLLIDGENTRDFLNCRMRRLVECLGDVQLFRGPVFVSGFGYSFSVLYEPFLVCQFNVNDRYTLTRNPMQAQNCTAIFDRTGYYTKYLGESEDLRVNEQEVFITSFTFFWLRSICVRNDLCRGQLWLAIRHLNDMRDQIFTLERLLKGSPPPGLNYLYSTKSFENDLGLVLSAEVGNTLCNYSAESVKEAFLATLLRYFNGAKLYAEIKGIHIEKQMAVASKLYFSMAGDVAFASCD